MFSVFFVAINVMYPLPQREKPELLDLHAGNLAEVRRSLGDIRRINTYLGGAKPVCDAVWDLLGDTKSATVLDIGTGNADIPLRLIQQAQKRGVDLKVIGLDINARHLQIAREDTTHCDEISLLGADAFQLPLRDKSVDVVISTLFLHHFRAPEIRALLREFSRVSRVGWTMHDQVRDALPLWFFRLARPLLATSYLTRYDAVASIYRAYTPAELRAIIKPIVGATVATSFPYRMSVNWQRAKSKTSSAAIVAGK